MDWSFSGSNPMGKDTSLANMRIYILLVAVFLPLCSPHIRIGKEMMKSVIEFRYSANEIVYLISELAKFYRDTARRCSLKRNCQDSKCITHMFCHLNTYRRQHTNIWFARCGTTKSQVSYPYSAFYKYVLHYCTKKRKHSFHILKALFSSYFILSYKYVFAFS